MLLLAAELWPFRATDSRFDDLLTSLRTEVFAIHLRNLILFLYPDEARSRNTDVSAHHYLPVSTSPEEWAKTCPKLTAALRDARDRASTEMAHLTTGRKSGTPPEKEWHPKLLMPDLRRALSAFLEQADPGRLGAEARAAIERLLTPLS